MVVSRIDILNQHFAKAFWGYRLADVDIYMQDVADAIGELGEDKAVLEARVEELEARLREFQRREEALRDTLLATQRMTENMKSNAEREAELILDAAHAKADILLNQEQMRLAKIREEIAEAKRMRAQFMMRVRSVVDEHLRLLDPEDAEETEGQQHVREESSTS